MVEANQPLLSICIPTFNRAEILRQTLAHLADTLDPSFEIVISNNCSGDHTVDVLKDFEKKWERFQYVTQTKEIDAIENAAVSLQMAKGKYCYVLHDDDRLIIDSLLKAAKIMEEREDIVGVYGGYFAWDPKTNDLTSPRIQVDKIEIFSKDSKLEIMRRFEWVVYPVIRNEICRRFCVQVCDKETYGQWPFIGKLLDHGSIAYTPYIFYKHASTVPRAEFTLNEGWVHDRRRATYEILVGSTVHGTMQNAQIIGELTVQAYLQGVRFAKIKGEWLSGRNYLLRARAYGLVEDKELLEYEQLYIVPMVTERLRNLVSMTPGIQKVILESHLISAGIQLQLENIMPEMDVCIVSREELLALPTKAENYIVAWEYQTLLDRSGSLEADPLRQHSLEDIFHNCCLLSKKINFSQPCEVNK